MCLWFYLHVYLISITSVLIMRHDIIRKKNLTFLKKDMIIKEIVDYCCSEKIVSLIHFLSTTSDIQTPWKFQLDVTQKPNVIWTWNLVRMFIFTWRLLSENRLELRLDPFKECKKANACLFSILRRILLLASAKASRMLSTYHVHVSFLNLIYT